MKLRRGLGILCGALLVISCAPVQVKLQEVRLPPQRIVQKGYSLVPLDESRWFLKARSPHELALSRTGDNPDETFVILATSADHLPAFNTTEDFLQFVKDRPSKDDPQRFKKFLRHDVRADTSRKTECALTHAIAEDTAAVRRSGRRDPMILEILDLICAHPDDKGVAVLVGYSHRYYPGKADPKFLEKATKLLSSVEFASF